MDEVTVVVPTRDRRALLDATLTSVLAQREVELEVVVVDDGSRDGTAQAVVARGDPRVRVVRHDRSTGVSAARDDGIAAAAGTWVAFCDDDDLWAPDKLALQLRAAAAPARDWVIAGAVVFTAPARIVATSEAPPPERVRAELPWRNVVPGGCSNTLVRKDLLGDRPAFDPALSNLADWRLWMRLCAAGPPAVVDRPLVAYRLHGSNLSLDVAGMLAEMDRVERATSASRGGAPIDRAYFLRWMGWSALRAGRSSDALRAYARAVRTGDHASLARAATVTMLGPRRAATLIERRLGVDPAWQREAARWLTPLAAGALTGR